MDRILFGDNQFFGVNHMSEEKARMQAMRFQDIAAVIEVLDDAYAEGIRTFMCTTHERISAVCDYYRVNREKYPDYKFYPCLPYAHKYANAAAELGVLGALRSFLPQENPLGALLKGGMSLARKDIEGLATLLHLLIDFGAMDGRLDLGAGANDAGVIKEAGYVRFGVRCNLLWIEVVKGLTEGVAFTQNGDPGEARLEAL